MEQSKLLYDTWSYLLPSLILGGIMYTLLGRFLLSIIFAPDSKATFWRTFKTISDPLIAPARVITPAVIPDRIVPLMAFVWVFMLRIGLFLTFLAAGYKLSAGT